MDGRTDKASYLLYVYSTHFANRTYKTHNSVSFSFQAIVCYNCGTVGCGMIDGTESCLHVALILRGRTSGAETGSGPFYSLHDADTARRSVNV